MCGVKQCSNPRHIIVEGRMRNLTRKYCHKQAREAANSLELPETCGGHDTPCLLRHVRRPLRDVLVDFEGLATLATRRRRTCDLCEITLSSDEKLRAHRRSKKHKKCEARVRGEAGIEAQGRWICDLCDDDFTTERSLRRHKTCAKHKIREAEVAGNTTGKTG